MQRFFVKFGIAVRHALADELLLCRRKTAAPAGIFGQVQPFAQTQLHQQKILRRAVALYFFGSCAVDKRLHVIGPVFTHTTHTAMGRRAVALIIAAIPVQQVMPSLVAGAAEVADLILLIPGFFQLVDRI